MYSLQTKELIHHIATISVCFSVSCQMIVRSHKSDLPSLSLPRVGLKSADGQNYILNATADFATTTHNSEF